MPTNTPQTTNDVTIELTSVPNYGSYHNLKGMVRNLDPERARIAVYIRVHGGWWTKPYWDSPATAISQDGSFSVDITTGGHDELAIEIATFLLPTEYYPPSLRGEIDLPDDLFKKALTHVGVTRSP